ncbi:MAG: hypothetical protein K1X75_10415 [Leptospirales bacterium]|nr:hypothetical protein [Leptospirales bacterium]
MKSRFGNRRPPRRLIYSTIGALLCALLSYAAFVSVMQIAPSDRRFYDSDSLYLPALLQEILRQPDAMRGWQTPPAHYLFPDGALLLFPLIATGKPIAALHVFGLQLYLLICLVIVGIAREILPRQAILYRLLPLLAIIAIYPAVAAMNRSTETLELVFCPGFHGGALLSSLFCLFLNLRQLKRYNWQRSVLVALTGALSLASDRIFAAYFIGPALLGAGVLFLLRRTRSNARIQAALLLPPLASIVLAWQLEKRIAAWSGLSSDQTLFADVLQQLKLQPLSIRPTILSGLVYLQQLHWTYALALILAVLAISFAAMRGLRSWHRVPKGDAIDTLLVRQSYAAAFALGMIASCALLGLMLGAGGRYIAARHLLPVFSTTLFGALLLPGLGRPRRRRQWFAAIYLIAILLSIGYSGRMLWRHWPRWSNYQPPESLCIDRIARRIGATEGYSDYWNARRLSVFSAQGLHIRQLIGKMQIYYHINNADSYFFGEGRNTPGLVLPQGLDRKAVLDTLGPPSAVTTCGGQEVFLYHTPSARDRYISFKNRQAQNVRIWQLATGRTPQPRPGADHD